ncbi:MAG: hypothetical protein PF589_03460, partial [Gammaproteobacteria bacterium]|nr:hypothetical protein [Gammaproteobacteria bacterium]
MIPSSQKNKPITFLLWDTQKAASLAQASFVIRPEELTRNSPSRNNATQTLDGAWVDGQGEGLETLTLAGHTGWRGTKSMDGQELFQQLYKTVYKAWHLRRAESAKAGRDPDFIELIFADQLNNMAVVVSPDQFQLRRHKTRPLLSQFNISMTVLREASESALKQIDPITGAINNPRGRYKATQASMSGTIKEQQEWSIKVDSALGFSMSGVATDVLNASTELLTAVTEQVNAASGYIDATLAPLMYTAMSFEQSARNMFQIMAAPAGLATQLKGELMAIASTFNDAYCLLLNGYGMLSRFPDFSDLFGASTCSTTGGGRPVSPRAGENPFLAMYPLENSPV